MALTSMPAREGEGTRSAGSAGSFGSAGFAGAASCDPAESVEAALPAAFHPVDGGCAEPAVESLGFLAGFVRMCAEGYRMGWHERNGGNASYRLRAEERAELAAFVAAKEASGVFGFAAAEAGLVSAATESAAADAVSGAAQSFADAGTSCPSTCRESAAWRPLGLVAPGLAGEWLLVTATGSYFGNIALCPDRALGVVELNGAGDAYRVLWGFEGGGRPTSELAAHVLIHEVKKAATDGSSRVLYHCHPAPVVALAHAVPHDGRAFTRLLWKMMTECVMVFPEGLGMVGCEVPGSMELARETADAARRHNAVVWAQHGLLATGSTCDETFGLMHVVVKAAEIYREACIMAGGPEKVKPISDEDLLVLAAGLGVTLNPEYL